MAFHKGWPGLSLYSSDPGKVTINLCLVFEEMMVEERLLRAIGDSGPLDQVNLEILIVVKVLMQWVFPPTRVPPGEVSCGCVYVACGCLERSCWLAMNFLYTQMVGLQMSKMEQKPPEGWGGQSL